MEEDASKVQGWLAYIVHSLHLLLVCKERDVEKQSCYEKASYKIDTVIYRKVGEIHTENISEKLPYWFELVYYERTYRSSYYNAIHAPFYYKNANKYERFLFALNCWNLRVISTFIVCFIGLEQTLLKIMYLWSKKTVQRTLILPDIMKTDLFTALHVRLTFL